MLIPPGLDDESARRHLLVAVDKHRQQLRRDGLVPPSGLEAFAAWLASPERYQRYNVEDRERALTRQRVRRWRARQREKSA